MRQRRNIRHAPRTTYHRSVTTPHGSNSDSTSSSTSGISIRTGRPKSVSSSVVQTRGSASLRRRGVHQPVGHTATRPSSSTQASPYRRDRPSATRNPKHAVARMHLVARGEPLEQRDRIGRRAVVGARRDHATCRCPCGARRPDRPHRSARAVAPLFVAVVGREPRERLEIAPNAPGPSPETRTNVRLRRKSATPTALGPVSPLLERRVPEVPQRDARALLLERAAGRGRERVHLHKMPAP